MWTQGFGQQLESGDIVSDGRLIGNAIKAGEIGIADPVNPWRRLQGGTRSALLHSMQQPSRLGFGLEGADAGTYPRATPTPSGTPTRSM
jgi:hypothetical protein